MLLKNNEHKQPEEFSHRNLPAAESSPDNTPQADAPPDAASDDDLEFVVTEAHEEGPQFVGMSDESSGQNDLGVESNADLMEPQADNDTSEPLRPLSLADEDARPIGTSEPVLPPEPAYDQPEVEDFAPATEPEPDGIKKLSEEEVRSINQSLYGDSSYLTDEEKNKLIDSIGQVEKPFSNTPITPPKRSQTGSGPDPAAVPPPAPAEPVESTERAKPGSTNRQRGIAFFYRSFIQIKGIYSLHEDDELQINERHYVLKPKVFSTKMLVAVAAPVFALLLFLIGVQFISDTDSGQGRIVGIVVDDSDQPYLQKAALNFPDLGKTFESNSQGFFTAGSIPAGNHKIEYIVGGDIVGVEYATVLGGEITTLLIRPSEQQTEQIAQAPTQPVRQQPVAAKPEPSKSASSETQQSSKKSSSSKSENKPSARASTAKLVLAANVEGARIAIDGQVLGAGNLTYNKMNPGQRKYEVSKDGFQTATGTITLKNGKTTRLDVTLEPQTQAAKEETDDEVQFLDSGLEMLRQGNLAGAMADFDAAITRDPSYAEAYYARAQASAANGTPGDAFDDYVRAAEIFYFRKDYNQAITCYSNAADLDNKSVVPLLGRADVYLAKGEQIAALADYEAVTKKDKKNARAYFGLGKARFEQGYYKKAVKWFKKARDKDENNPETHQFLMLSYLGANDISNVKKSYDKFKKAATDEQLAKFHNDNRFTAVIRVIETDS